MSRLLALVAGGGEHSRELRSWLTNDTQHSRPLNRPLLDSSLCYRVEATPAPPPGVPPTDIFELSPPPPSPPPTSPSPPPPPMITESLLVPMFRRDRFILGELFGDVSPNSLALRMMPSGGQPLVQRARRFVVDLGIQDSIEFVEYEWFSDGKLIVSMHNISLDGDYQGQSIVLDSTDGMISDDSVAVSGGGDVRKPMRVVMRLSFDETVDCSGCLMSRSMCLCETGFTRIALPRKESTTVAKTTTSWSHWLAAFGRTRCGLSTNSCHVTALTPLGEMQSTMHFRLNQSCEHGQESGVRLLRRKYAARLAMTIARPGIEIPIDERDIANAVSNVVESTSHIVSDLPSSADIDVTSGGVSPWAPVSTSEETHSGADACPDYPLSNGERSWRNTRPVDVQFEGADNRPITRPTTDIEHGSGKNFYCDCGMIFKHKGHLNVHVLTRHLKLRPFACSRCSSTFAKRSDLRRHAKSLHKVQRLEGDWGDVDAETAALIKPYACETCQRRYVTRQGLRKHRVARHGPSQRVGQV